MKFDKIFYKGSLVMINSALLIYKKIYNPINKVNPPCLLAYKFSRSTCSSPCASSFLSKIQQERNDDCVLRGLNDKFFQVWSQILLMELMLTLPKSFSLVLQRECEFHGLDTPNPQDYMVNLNFQA